MIVIGGSSSTGSSLLAQMLNRHPSIVCGSETSLLARPQLFEQWNKYKNCLGRTRLKKLRNPGWHRYYGVEFDSTHYGISNAALAQMAAESKHYIDFIRSLESQILDYHQKSIWAEKTPSNCNAFQLLLRSELDVRLVLMVRNPYDAIASLIRRGFSPLYSTATFLVNTAMGHIDHPHVCCIKYEELITDSHDCLSSLFSYIEEPINDSIWLPENKHVKMDGWKNDETGPIRNTSINRFNSLDLNIQQEVIQLTNLMEVNPQFAIFDQKPALKNIESICSLFDYDFIKQQNSITFKHRTEVAIEKIKRSLLGYKTGITNFPIQWKK